MFVKTLLIFFFKQRYILDMATTSKRRNAVITQIFFAISVVALLYHLKDATSILLSKEFTLLILEYHSVTRKNIGCLTKFAQHVSKH